jgi:hypothetical protein
LQDLQIVCNIRSQEAVPKGTGYPEAITIDILEIRNHPSYKPLNKATGGSQDSGPINGYDISVYIVDDSKLAGRMNTSAMWPACLPRFTDTDHLPGNRGILAGWADPLPTYLGKGNNLETYANNYLVTREGLFEQQPACSDPAWMQSRTYYPPGTVCYTEAAWAGSVQFGLSGSGLMRPFADSNGATRYSYAGPLSASKGSDRSIYSDIFGIIDYSSNPAIFTDARCYLDWIAAQYGLSLPSEFSTPSTCSLSMGEKTAVNITKCLSRPIRVTDASNQPSQCLFVPGFEKCQLFAYNHNAKPNYNLNFYYCQNTKLQPAVCANDCPGVDPNAVVVGGEVALLSIAVASVVGPDIIGPVLGAGVGLAGLGLGNAAMNRNRVGGPCPTGQCRPRNSRRCCNLAVRNGQLVCPLSC